MQAVVLAAGRGTRLRPLTDDRPKALVEVAGRPVLTRCFEALADLPVEEVVVVVGYRADAIVDRYGGAYRHLPLTYARQEERRGVADAIAAAEPHVEGTFVAVHGDYLFGGDLSPVLERHARDEPAATLLVEAVPDDEATGFGVCEFDGAGDLVGLVEKPDDPPSNTVITGCFAFEPVVFEACRAIEPSGRGEYELADAVDWLLRAGHGVELVHAESWLVNVNTSEDVVRAERLLDPD